MRLNPLSSRRNVTLNQLLENWQNEVDSDTEYRAMAAASSCWAWRRPA